MCVRRVLRARSASLGEYQLLMEKHPCRDDRTGGWIIPVYGDESGEIGSRDVSRRAELCTRLISMRDSAFRPQITRNPPSLLEEDHPRFRESGPRMSRH